MKSLLEREIHTCENITDWSHNGLTLALSAIIYCEGKYSIHFQANGANTYCEYSFGSSQDFSVFTHIKLWAYSSAPSDFWGFKFWLFTDAGNYAYWSLSIGAQSSWRKMSCLLSNPTSEIGTLDLSNITKMRYSINDASNHQYFDFIFVSKDITSDVINGLSFIECPIRDFHKAEFMAKGTWVPQKDDIIRIEDYYTSNGSSTANFIIFRGSIVDYELTSIRKIWCESRAKRDLDEFRPSGDYNGDLDSNHIKTLIAECSYITEGTIDATTGNTDNTFKGDKTFRTILNDWADKHYKHWYLSPTGVLTFNDADIDSGEDFDQDDTIWNVKPKKHVDFINWVMLLGAIVNGVHISAESKDTDSIKQLGAKIYKDTYSIIMATAQLQIAADNLRTREQLLPLAINYWYYRVNKGLIQVGETATFEHDKMNPAITSRQVILNKVIYRFLSGHTNLQTTDGISFVKDKDKSLPQENSQLLQQKDKFVWRVPEPLGNDMREGSGNTDFSTIGDVADTWYDIDLSSIIPVGTTTIEVRIFIKDGALGSKIQFRKDGQTGNVQVLDARTVEANIDCPCFGKVGVSADRKIEFLCNPKASDLSEIYFLILGYQI